MYLLSFRAAFDVACCSNQLPELFSLNYQETTGDHITNSLVKLNKTNRKKERNILLGLVVTWAVVIGIMPGWSDRY